MPSITPVSSVNNSTKVEAMEASVTWTGTLEDVSLYNVVVIQVAASAASSTNGITLLFQGPQGSSRTASYTAAAGVPLVITERITAKSFRLSYTNGANPSNVSIDTLYRYSDIPDDVPVSISGDISSGTLSVSVTNSDVAGRLRSPPAPTAIYGGVVPTGIYDFQSFHYVTDNSGLLYIDNTGLFQTPGLAPTTGVAASAFISTRQRFRPTPGLSTEYTFHILKSSPLPQGIIILLGALGVTDYVNDTLADGVRGYCLSITSSGLTFGYAIGWNGMASGSATQSNWNIDTMDGTGPSKKTLSTVDISFSIEMLNGPAGQALLSFYIGGQRYPAHLASPSVAPGGWDQYMTPTNGMAAAFLGDNTLAIPVSQFLHLRGMSVIQSGARSTSRSAGWSMPTPRLLSAATGSPFPLSTISIGFTIGNQTLPAIGGHTEAISSTNMVGSATLRRLHVTSLSGATLVVKVYLATSATSQDDLFLNDTSQPVWGFPDCLSQVRVDSSATGLATNFANYCSLVAQFTARGTSPITYDFGPEGLLLANPKLPHCIADYLIVTCSVAGSAQGDEAAQCSYDWDELW